MKIVVTDTWASLEAPKVMSIAEALKPDAHYDENPRLSLIDDVRALQSTVGILLGTLVEKGALSLDEAQAIAKLDRYKMHIHEPGTYGED